MRRWVTRIVSGGGIMGGAIARRAAAGNRQPTSRHASGSWHLPRQETPAFAGVTTRVGVTTRSEEHTSELQSLMRISYAVFCLNKQKEITCATHPYKKIQEIQNIY